MRKERDSQYALNELGGVLIKLSDYILVVGEFPPQGEAAKDALCAEINELCDYIHTNVRTVRKFLLQLVKESDDERSAETTD